MDIRMPVMDGVEATGLLTRGDRPVRVVVLTTFDLDEYIVEALRNGASGFLLKDAPATELVSAVRVVAEGGALLAPSVTRRLLDTFAHRLPRGGGSSAAVSDLTQRELEVLGLLAAGRSNAEIAAELFVSETTVKTHVSRVLMKLDLRDRVQAVVFAYENGIVEPGKVIPPQDG
jgi:DNA-binding NarL/FixJ family response regulator